MQFNSYSLLFLLLFAWGITGQEQPERNDIPDEGEWVREIMNEMTLEEKIGQLFMIRAHSDKGQDHIAQVSKYIEEYHVGGLCFFQGTPVEQARLTNKYQALADIPLLVAMDAEWGLGMRFPNSSLSFPRQLMLGAIQDNTLIYEMGREIGIQLKRIGVHVNFAPVIDVNNNPGNPVINDRSFGEDRHNVTGKGYAYMKGLQDSGVLACAKHFPGHGDTDIDSHHDLPVIRHNKRRLDSIELMPFRMLTRQGLDAVMVAHLHMPALDNRPNRPTTLSSRVVEDLLISEIGFSGLIFTDAMEMQGVAKHFTNGEAELEAFIAGNDFIVLPPDLPIAFNRIKTAIQGGLISMERLDKSVKKILDAKFRIGLTKSPEINHVERIPEEVNSSRALALKSKLIEHALTLVGNNDRLLPLIDIETQKIASLSIGSGKVTKFQERLESYDPDITHLFIPKEISQDQWQRVKHQCARFDVIIVSLHDLSKYASRNFGIHPQTVSIIRELASEAKVILNIFGSPYSLKFFEGLPNVIVSYDEDELTQDLAAQAVFGASEFSGKLPVSASSYYLFGKGINTPAINRLGFSIPERVGLNHHILDSIDLIVEEMIKEEAAPGCQILVAKDGKIVFNKAYGYHTYDKKQPTTLKDVYDLASVTKTMASTLAVMKLHEGKKINIYKPVKNYIPEAENSNKANLIIEDILSHHAGLLAWIPYYAKTLDSTIKKPRPSSSYYREAKSDSFNIQVADKLFLRSDYRDTIWSIILGSELRPRRNYLYSDLGFYMMAEIIERVTGKSIDEYVKEQFYSPLGLSSTGYNPREFIEENLIVPSEKDDYFRFQVLKGYVHDMGAAMMGGIGGHAGLFSNTQDIAVLMQMLLNGGTYGGKKYLEPETINTFTNRYYRSSRKAIGFDMKELNGHHHLNMSEKASLFTFGHMGFTGTVVFADPGHNIIYIFLSNRTFPTMKNNKFGENEYRPRVQSVIYNALMD